MFDERAFVFCTLKIGISYKVIKSPPLPAGKGVISLQS